MAIKSALGVEVGDTETEIIESTLTFTDEDRIFGVGNGDKEIIATAWGSDDNHPLAHTCDSIHTLFSQNPSIPLSHDFWAVI